MMYACRTAKAVLHCSTTAVYQPDSESPKRPTAHTSFVRASSIAIGRPTMPVAPVIKILVSCSTILFLLSIGEPALSRRRGSLPRAASDSAGEPLAPNGSGSPALVVLCQLMVYTNTRQRSALVYRRSMACRLCRWGVADPAVMPAGHVK